MSDRSEVTSHSNVCLDEHVLEIYGVPFRLSLLRAWDRTLFHVIANAGLGQVVASCFTGRPTWLDLQNHF